MTKQSQSEKKDKPNSQKEKYRTRHVALQFSYDGTDYTGFAQNVGKENDDSIDREGIIRCIGKDSFVGTSE